jgi:hypothetical protein
MIPQTYITKSSQASPGWPVMFVRTETFGRTVLRFANQYRPPTQGCFPMTD